MKLEVGMYCRYKNFQNKVKIAKIKGIQNANEVFQYDYITFDNDEGELKTNIIKASFNITDILEVGDIVIIEDFVDEACMIFKDMYYLQNEQQLFNLKNDLARNKNKKISRILTKEQFEQISYKVGE